LALFLPHGTSAALVQKLNSASADQVAPDCRSPNYLQKFVESDTTGVSMD
jgi:hypothetical protein